MIQTQLASAPDSGVLLSDEALDGSGSGARPSRKKGGGYYTTGDRNVDCPDCEDEDGSVDDRDDDEASGSGSGPATISELFFVLVLPCRIDPWISRHLVPIYTFNSYLYYHDNY